MTFISRLIRVGACIHPGRAAIVEPTSRAWSVYRSPARSATWAASLAIWSVAQALVIGVAARGSIISGGAPDPAWNSNAMQLWYKGDAGVLNASNTPATNGQPVATWVNQSTQTGRDSTQSNASFQPLYSSPNSSFNDQATVGFSDDYLAVDNGDELNWGSDSFTIFTVFNWDTDSVSENAFIFDKRNQGGTSGGTNRYTLYIRPSDSAPGLNFIVGDDSGAVTVAAPGSTDYAEFLDGTVWISAAVVDRSTNFASLYLAGGDPGSVSIAGLGPQSNTTPLRFGANSLQPSNYFGGDIAEVLMYSGALSDADLDAVGGYLAGEYAAEWTVVVPEPGGIGLLMGGVLAAGAMIRRNGCRARPARHGR